MILFLSTCKLPLMWVFQMLIKSFVNIEDCASTDIYIMFSFLRTNSFCFIYLYFLKGFPTSHLPTILHWNTAAVQVAIICLRFSK